jgi:nucleotide-binding universal stress UspA family protein
MFSLSKIILPVDFSERSFGAARYAEALADHYGSVIHMVHVVPPLHYEFAAMEGSAGMLNELYSSRMETLDEQLQVFLKAELPGLKACRIMLEGDPARVLVDYAHNTRADLIVLPTHGYGPFRRFILGSVTAKVLHDADCPVWTGIHLEQAPAVEKIHFRTVVAAVDLGSHSEKTLLWAAGFAAEQRARLVVAHATPSIEGQVGEYFDPEWRLGLQRQASERLAELKTKTGVVAEDAVDSGDPPRVICEAATSSKADLLVIGRGSASGIFGRLRANAYAIIRQAPCPVVSV